MLKSILRNVLKNRQYKNSTSSYLNLYKRIIDANPELAKPAEKEKEWLEYWEKYDKNLSPLYCRVFSRYVNEDIKQMIPLEFIASIIEPILTPLKQRFFYSDKNNFNILLTKEYMPLIYLRNIDGFFYDENYNHLKKEDVATLINTFSTYYDKVILKPSRSDSGKGVQIFYACDGALKNKKGEELSLELLQRQYQYNYLLQECISQSDYLSQFNSTSINTIRMAVYRDINGNEHCLSAGLRIGASGAEVDNAHAGGVFCGISKDGKIGNWVCNQFGEKQTQYNGLNFDENEWSIPNYSTVKQFAIDVSKKLIHNDLIALDIALDKNNNPVLIEFNVGGFGSWFFLMGGNSVFGEFTEEIMERCFKAYQDLEYYIWSPISRDKKSLKA